MPGIARGSCREAGFTGTSDRMVWQVDGSNGENTIKVQRATPAEVWLSAVEAAAAAGMLPDWPRLRESPAESRATMQTTRLAL